MRKSEQSDFLSKARLRRGASLVELALVFPFLLTIIFGLVEFSRFLMVKQAITNAAREGAREAALITSTDASKCDAKVRQYLSSSIANSANVSQVRVTVNPASLASITTETTITVDVEINYSDVSFFPASFLGSTVIKAQATMKRE